MIPLLALIFALQWADGWTTRRVLDRGGRELNPVMRWAFARIGFWPAIALKSVIAVGASWAAMMEAEMIGLDYWWPGVLIAAVWVAVVIHNWRAAK